MACAHSIAGCSPRFRPRRSATLPPVTKSCSRWKVGSIRGSQALPRNRIGCGTGRDGPLPQCEARFQRVKLDGVSRHGAVRSRCHVCYAQWLTAPMPKVSDIPICFSNLFLTEVKEVARQLDAATIERMAALLASVRERSGRLFILGVGGSAGNASHAVNDFRKLVGIETYAPTDNVSELTARVNDEGWPTVFEAWLRVSRLQSRDAILVFSVGGGSVERNVSPNIVAALDYGKSVGASVLGIVGRDGGYTARVADVCVIIPTVHADRVTPHSEAFQAIVWHLLVSHPALQQKATKWESITPAR